MIRRLTILAAAAAGAAVPLLLASAGAAVPRPRAIATRAPDLGGQLTIRDGSCHFSPQIAAAFERMMTFSGPGRPVVHRIRIGGMSAVPRLTYRAARSSEYPDWSARAEATLPRPALWNGLSVRALRVEAEHEGFGEGIILNAPPESVQRVLRRLGIRAPLPPGLLELPVTECAASLSLRRVRGGTALICSGGC